MVRTEKGETLGRQELLYDPVTVERLVEQYGPPTEIKHNVKTPATIYEIRTAVRFWTGGRTSHRTSDRVWQKCKAIYDEQWELDGNELVYA